MIVAQDLCTRTGALLVKFTKRAEVRRMPRLAYSGYSP
jgi:hypothetical protein